MVEFADSREERSLRSESADVKLIDYGFMPGAAFPAGIAPGVCRRINDFAGA
jgi:hypothetical protein